MRIHPIQTGTVAVHARQREGVGPGPLRVLATLADRTWTAPLPILSWLIEHPEGPILVDTGETAQATRPGWFTPWNPYFRLAVRVDLTEQDEVGPQLERIGVAPADVRRTVLTHLHTDHAGGLSHVAGSEILVSRREAHDAAGTLGKARGYLPQHLPPGFAPTLVDFAGPAFGPFAASHPVTADGTVVLLPTPGHTPGHLSVAVRLEQGLVILAGDASYTEAAMRSGTADGVTNAPATARDTLARLRALAGQGPSVYLPAHDPESVVRLQAFTG